MDISIPGTQRVPGDLLQAALTHSSYRNEHPESTDYERLEFLGDAVVSLACSSYLLRQYPALPEGELTLLRASMVSTTALAARARELGLSDKARLGKGTSRKLNSILADIFEAVVGAIFIGCGYGAAEKFAIEHLAGTEQHVGGKDYKSRLQEYLQSFSNEIPEYVVVKAEGPDHERRYTVVVHHAGTVLGTGTGLSKKQAEQAAAAAALEEFEAKGVLT